MFHFSHCIVLFNNYIVLYCSSLFFKSSRSLLNVSCILSVGASIHFLRLWIIFTIVALNTFQGWLPIFTSLSCSSGVLSCSFLWNIFSCHLILSNLLCLWSLLLRLQNCNFSCFWCLFLVSGFLPGSGTWDPPHDKVMREKTWWARRIRFSGIPKSCPRRSP